MPGATGSRLDADSPALKPDTLAEGLARTNLPVAGLREAMARLRGVHADLTSGAIERGFCGAPPRIDARGTTRWRHLIPRAARKRLPRARYVVLVRAVNGYGRTTTIKRRLRVR